MLRKLVREHDVYECSCLLVLDGAQGVAETSGDEEDDRGPNEEPAALLPLPSDETDEEGEEAHASLEAVEVRETTSGVSLLSDDVPADLGADRFFEVLIRAALERMPVAVYPEVRHRLMTARGEG